MIRNHFKTASTIQRIVGRQILDSRGLPTVVCDLYVKDAVFSSGVPSGASTGKYEAVELRDGDNSKFHGKGVLKAVENVKKIEAALKGKSVLDQRKIDQALIALDGTPNKGNLGANSILGVSMSVARAAASAHGMYLWHYLAKTANNSTPSLPLPYLNVINGGKHADNLLACQQFMICPQKATSFADSMRQGCEVYQNLKKLIKKKYKSTGVGDEGGFAPPSKDAQEALQLLMQALKDHAGVRIALDVAASQFFNQDKKNYNLNFKGDTPHQISGQKLVDFYLDLAKRYPIKSIEDPFDQDDFERYKSLMSKKDKHLQIVGDDLLVTNISRIKMAHQKGLVNALLLKVNQIGTVTESIEAANFCKEKGWGIMVSHRSGETQDNFIADLVVGLGAGQIKSGGPCRSERLAKYNRLMAIEQEMKDVGVKPLFPSK